MQLLASQAGFFVPAAHCFAEMINHDVKPYSYEVDWWSLAVTFYNLVTGVRRVQRL